MAKKTKVPEIEGALDYDEVPEIEGALDYTSPKSTQDMRDAWMSERESEPELGAGTLTREIAEGAGEALVDAVKTTPNNLLLRQGPNIARKLGQDEFAQDWQDMDNEARERSPITTMASEFITPNPLATASKVVKNAGPVVRFLTNRGIDAATGVAVEHGATGESGVDTAAGSAVIGGILHGVGKLATKGGRDNLKHTLNTGKNQILELANRGGGSPQKGFEELSSSLAKKGLFSRGTFEGYDVNTGKFKVKSSYPERLKEQVVPPSPSELNLRINGKGEVKGARTAIGEEIEAVVERSAARVDDYIPGTPTSPGQFTRETLREDERIRDLINRNSDPANDKVINDSLVRLVGPEKNLDKLSLKLQDAQFKYERSLKKARRSSEEATTDWAGLDLKAKRTSLKKMKEDAELLSQNVANARKAKEIADEELLAVMGEDGLKVKKKELGADKAETALESSMLRSERIQDKIEDLEELLKDPNPSPEVVKKINRLREDYNEEVKKFLRDQEKYQDAMREKLTASADEEAAIFNISDLYREVKDINKKLDSAYSVGKTSAQTEDVWALKEYRNILSDMIEEGITNPAELAKFKRLKKDFRDMEAVSMPLMMKEAGMIPDPAQMDVKTYGGNTYVSGGLLKLGGQRAGEVKAQLHNSYESGNPLMPFSTRGTADGIRSRGVQPFIQMGGQQEDPGRTPQSITPQIEGGIGPQSLIDPDKAVREAVIPRTFEGLMQNRDIILAKAARYNPELVPALAEALSKDPRELKDMLPVLVTEYPQLFEYDEYGRVDGVIIDPAVQQKARKDIHNDESLSNVQKAVLLNKLNRTGKLEGYKQ